MSHEPEHNSAHQASVAFIDGPAVSLPCISRDRFANLAGLTPSTVYSMCDRGYLPTIHFGRRVFVNLEALRQECAAAKVLA